MSKFHTPASGGYTDKNGKFKKAVMVVGTTDERISAYVWLANLQATTARMEHTRCRYNRRYGGQHSTNTQGRSQQRHHLKPIDEIY